MSTVTPTVPSAAPTAADHGLSPARLNLMRAGFLLMGVGLALVKWPLLPHAASLPFYDGATLCLLTAMSLLAFLGLRYPIKLLPILLFEVGWKLTWLGVVALPLWLDGNLTGTTREQAGWLLWVTLVIAVIPWRHVANQFVTAPGDRWR